MELNTFTKLLSAVSLSLALSSCGSEDSDSRVAIGIADTIITNGAQYSFPIVVQVADFNGAPSANTQVSITLKTVSFTKGFYTFDNDIDGDTIFDQWQTNNSVGADCPAEDGIIARNGILDVGEDANGNGLLEPDTPTLTQHPDELPTLLGGTSTLVTDDNGFGYFTLSYPSSEALWVTVELTASAQDGLPENQGIETFRLPVALDDINDAATQPPGGLVSPYGQSATCADTL